MDNTQYGITVVQSPIVTVQVVVTRAGEDEDPLFPGVQVQTGRAVVTALLSQGNVYPIWMGWGTGLGTTNVTNTDLFTPGPEARVKCTTSQITTNTLNDTIQIVGTMFCQGSGKTILNLGTFDGPGIGSPPAGNNLYVMGDFQGVGQFLNVGDSIQGIFTAQYF